MDWIDMAQDRRLLPDNMQHPQDTDIHAPYRIRTRNPSKQTVADPLYAVGTELK